VGAAVIERRVPCGSCGALVVEGAKKCRACKSWLVSRPEPPAPPQPVAPRIAIVLGSALATLMVVLVSGRESKVGEAPPLTNLSPDSSAAPGTPAPAAIGPEPGLDKKPKLSPDPSRSWRVRQFKVGDVRPLDVLFHPNGNSVYVSCDDATLREYKLATGELLHQAQMPAQGDQIRLLYGRYVAILRHEDAARIPVMDTAAWDKDPILLDVGQSPGDLVELPDGRTVVTAATESKHIARFDLPSGTRLADITLPHATGQLFLVQAEGRPYVAAIGALTHAGRQAGSWIDLFDPAETPFGATRRSIPLGRELGAGDVSSDGTLLLFPDRVSNSATLLTVSAITTAGEVAVGASPIAGFIFDDRYGITLNAASKTASVIDLGAMDLADTLMLDGVPRSGALSPDRKMLFVAMGGDTYPPAGASVTVIAGDPPRVVTSLATGRGATSVTVSPDGTRAAVACWSDKSITVFEQEAPPAAQP
jgi:DNA-binding beta-propeller fold protein YncE